MLEVSATSYFAQRLDDVSPIWQVCPQCVGYAGIFQGTCFPASRSSVSGALKCWRCRTRRVSCKWGQTTPKQMATIKIRIHEANRLAGDGLTATAEEEEEEEEEEGGDYGHADDDDDDDSGDDDDNNTNH